MESLQQVIKPPQRIEEDEDLDEFKEDSKYFLLFKVYLYRLG